MNDSGTVTRKAYYDAWNGAITYDSSVIPVVDEKLDLNITEHDLYILIGAQNEADASNKTRWAQENELGVTVVNLRKATNSKTAVENIVNQMLQIVFPAKNTYGLTLTSPFNLSYAKYTSGDYSFEKMHDGWKISKQLTFKNRITQ